MLDKALRQQGVCGSDVGAIFGCDPYRDEFTVWAEKKGHLPEQAPEPRMIVGKVLEPAILKLYEIVTKREIDYCDKTQQHPARPWHIYTPDAICKHERRGVDAKCVSTDQRFKWGATANDIPERIQLQAWWYMAAMEFDVWDVVAFTGDGLPRVYEIERDREAERVMLARAESFYRKYLAGDEIPPIGGSTLASQWLQQAFPQHKRPDLRPASDPEVALLREYAELRLAQNLMVKDRAILENRLRQAVADREGLTWEGGKFTWRKTKDREFINWEAIARGLRSKCEAETWDTLLGLHTVRKPGGRRIWFDSTFYSEISDAKQQQDEVPA